MSIGSFVKGDNITINCNINEDITNWKIRCSIYEPFGLTIKLATINTGGSNDQIEITTPLTGKFSIKVAKDLTKDFCEENNRANIEIEVETDDVPSKKYTVLQDTIELKDQGINWTSPS